MKLADRIRATREAGMVERAHVVPHLRQYSNAAHTWGVCVLLRLLWPDQPHLVDFALFHDVPERWTGDWPAQVIRNQPKAAEALEAEDRRISSRLAIPSEHALGHEDWVRFKAADRLELWLWTFDEEAMGNRMVLGVRAELDKMFNRAEAEGTLPPEVAALIATFREEGWRRLPEVLDGD